MKWKGTYWKANSIAAVGEAKFFCFYRQLAKCDDCGNNFKKQFTRNPPLSIPGIWKDHRPPDFIDFIWWIKWLRYKAEKVFIYEGDNDLNAGKQAAQIMKG